MKDASIAIAAPLLIVITAVALVTASPRSPSLWETFNPHTHPPGWNGSYNVYATYSPALGAPTLTVTVTWDQHVFCYTTPTTFADECVFWRNAE